MRKVNDGIIARGEDRYVVIFFLTRIRSSSRQPGERLPGEYRNFSSRVGTPLLCAVLCGGLSGKKGTLLEGGIRVPAIIEWPAVVKKHRKIDLVCNTTDIYPTLLELTGVKVDYQPVLDGWSILLLICDEKFNGYHEYGFWDYSIGG